MATIRQESPTSTVLGRWERRPSATLRRRGDGHFPKQKTHWQGRLAMTIVLRRKRDSANRRPQADDYFAQMRRGDDGRLAGR